MRGEEGGKGRKGRVPACVDAMSVLKNLKLQCTGKCKYFRK